MSAQTLLSVADLIAELETAASLEARHRGCALSVSFVDVEDNCGGLPPGGAERMFLPFTQYGADRSGVGFGLAICRRSVESNQGVLSVRDRPGTGCMFTIDLPRHSAEPSGAFPRQAPRPDR